ncbi:DUF3969 family protein [Desulfocucumis palustris]|uniref:DUF3969 family protein n=1 Tax=Desulfocucumis palustris TaxID=1898651 RepID=UPI000CEA68CB|nr:DUF3969 family protein [Desulfocucumis palustris]
MELKISVSKKNEIERILTILELGMLTALEKGSIKIDEAEGYLFNPYTVDYLEKLGLNNKVIEVIRQGCELEDVESLFPQKLRSAIHRLKEETMNILESLTAPNLPTEKLIKK